MTSGYKQTEMGVAKAHAESEFEQYRIVRDRLFESNFDKLQFAPPEGDA
jgi:hypothetical protein